MNKRFALTLIAFGLVAALTGCGGSGSPASATAPSTGKEVVVRMVEMAFDQATLQVPAGTTVRWINDGQAAHSVWEGTPGSGKSRFKSAHLSPGKWFDYRFEVPGTYEIFCNTGSHHLIGMKMSVVVN
ncbi:MAG TPA: plastocyanin/azurin family copper-binding protein [Symbiobacteriaceae bacterium]|nr:plastocyanin/azurin family copper-binding protein [Symbiobacteriaceae bacterium]